MKPSVPHILSILLPLLLPVSGASSYPKCPSPQPPTIPPGANTTSGIFPKSVLVDFYYQPPTQQSSEAILDRLESESKIRNKLTLYGLATDGKNFTGYERVFYESVVTYLPPFGLVSGLADVKAVVQKALEPYDTQSLFGTQVIKVYEDDPCRASTLTYFSTTFFGKGDDKGKV